MKTPEEVEDLKREWEGNPHWNLEDTDGFEDHKEELREFSKNKYAEWEAGRENRLTTKAKSLGCSVALVQYIEALEYKVDHLVRKVHPNG